MNYDPLKIVGETFEHLRQKPLGHVKVSLLLFVALQVTVWTLMCFGMFGFVGGMVATDGNNDAQAVMVVMMMVGFFAMFLFLMPPLMVFFYGYQAATLDEVDGKGDVSPGVVLRNLMGLGVSLLGLLAVQCGLGVAGLLLCYVGAFFTSLPLRYAFLLKVDRKLGVMDAVAAAWEGFWAKPGAHFAAMAVGFILTMVLSYIPLIGPMVLWPVVAVFEAKSYRALYGPNQNSALAAG